MLKELMLFFMDSVNNVGENKMVKINENAPSKSS